jgi:hypothetical protein
MHAGLEVYERGHYPFIPHLTHFVDLYSGDMSEFNLEYEDYMEWDLAFLEVCDALLYLDPSPGADRELQKAEEMGIPAYGSVHEIPAEGDVEQ